MISFIRYTGETMADGILSQGPYLPDPAVSNDKDIVVHRR